MPSELSLYLESISVSSSNAVREAVAEVVKRKAYEFYDELKLRTPQASSGLKESLKITPLNGRYGEPGWADSRFGYNIEYDGYNEKGRPYPLIANAINVGEFNHKDLSKLGYIRKAVHYLKGMDQEISERYFELQNKYIESGQAHIATGEE